MIPVLGGSNSWVIHADERRKHEEQFLNLKPVNGYISGQQARDLFVKSNLPASILAQIWELSDLDKDGKMDKREFAIAMHLIQKKLKGVQLPSTLPGSLKMDSGTFVNAPSMNLRGPVMPAQPIGLPFSPQPMLISAPMAPVSMARPAFTPSTIPNVLQPSQPSPPANIHMDWAMPHSSKLKYSQQFNGIDKEKTGFLNGPQARSVFGRSDLPSATLAKIWVLADLDKDGRLTADEFCIASHLIDMAKRGAVLPATLPAELAPANWQRGGVRHQRTESIGSTDAPLSPKLPSLISSDGDFIKAPKMVVTFEDKRRQNLERGQAEIERRRMLLQEQEKREREERERKQREIREREERERQAKELRRRMEIEREQAKLRLEEEKREQEFKRMLEQKEAARQEAERQRKMEMERQRLQELRNEYQREEESVRHWRQRHKRFSYQVQSLGDKARQINSRVTEMRQGVVSATNWLETMKTARDRAVFDIENGKRMADQLRSRLAECDNEKVRLLARKRMTGQGATAFPSADPMEKGNLENLRLEVTAVSDQVQRKQVELENKEKTTRNVTSQAQREILEYRELVGRVNSALDRVRRSKGKGTRPGVLSNGHGTAAMVPNKSNTVVYQAVYDFQAAAEGELSLKAGDSIVVFIDHPTEEGWLAGQVGDNVGWFPRDFAVPLDNQSTQIGAEQTQTPAVHQPMENAVLPASPKEDAVSVTATAMAQQWQQEDETGEWYTAVYPFSTSEPGDLGFEVGERIRVIQKSGEWWTGEIGDRQGIFPCNYVQAVAVDDPSEVPVHQQEPTEQRPVVNVSEDVNQGPSEHEEPCEEVARAIAQFQAADSNQLSLEVGDLVKVRGKSPTGWWEGEVQRKGEPKKVGWFPGSYVELLEAGGNGGGQEESGDNRELETVEALFDYAKQRDDELSFAKGSAIVVLDKSMDSWWKGRLEDGQVGLFPVNYITSRPSSTVSSIRNGERNEEEPQRTSAVSTPTSELRKRSMYCQELEQTEQNYADDLQMVMNVFYKQFEVSGLVTPKEMSTLFINWTQLLNTARSFAHDLHSAGEESIESAILKNMENLKRVFVPFCRHQQSALDFLESKEKASARFRALHAQCSQHPAARGLQLSYFLLIPLARVTKYHLVVNEILKNTPKDRADWDNLKTSHTALRKLCDEVNQVATETENLQMLYWCQNHIKSDSIQPKLVFHSPTNSLGPRRFVHSGILFKTSSNRLLVGLLFNDFLMLTTPDEKISQPDTFKLNRSSEISLSLYKSPILLSKATVGLSPGNTGDPDDASFLINHGDDAISLRAVSTNARTLWMKQLEKTIKLARDGASARSRSLTISSTGIGRLLFEVVFVRNLVIPHDCKGASFYIEFALGEQKHAKSIDLTRTDTLCTTQMVLESSTGSMKLAIFAERIYSPDVCVGRTEMELGNMLKMSAPQRNPAVLQLALTSDFTPQTDAVSGHVIVKFVVQLFDDQ